MKTQSLLYGIGILAGGVALADFLNYREAKKKGTTKDFGLFKNKPLQVVEEAKEVVMIVPETGQVVDPQAYADLMEDISIAPADNTYQSMQDYYADMD